jgi:hypothetical protein
VLLPLVLALPASAVVWSALFPQAQDAAQAAPEAAAAIRQACRRPQDLRALAGLPPMRLLTTLDAGPYILVETPHSVLAGPYHRNVDGNVAALRTFLAPPAQAAQIARASGARHLAFCAGQADVDGLAARAPDGLAAHLVKGDVPGWLTNPVKAGTWTIYEINQ